MKFLADMGISPATVDFLCDLGYDAVHLHAQNLDRLSDAMILEKAQLENRIILTHDLDFGELAAASGTSLPSVIVFRLRSMRPEHVNGYLHSVILQYANALKDGAIISVTEGLVRVRSLPIRPHD
jgi:predicted nuclease of predicted toxin-antitoxin system